MRNKICSRNWVVLSLLLLSASTTSVRGQQPPGPSGYCFPSGGKPGTTVEVRLGGVDWTPDVELLVHDPRVKLEVLSKPGEVLMHEPPYWFGIKSYSNDPPLSREVSARIVIPEDMPPGPIHWTAVNANGGGGGGVFIVGDAQPTEITEDENRSGPQEISTLPATINGRLGRIEQIDRYRFRASESGLMTCDLMARRLGSDFLAVIEIQNEAGDKLAESFDTEGYDPSLTFAVKQGSTYTVLVREIDHAGYRSYTYRLSITPGPTVRTTIPLAGRRGETRKVEFIGVGVVTGEAKLESTSKEVVFPADGHDVSYFERLERPFGTVRKIEMTLSDTPEFLESEANHPLDLPVAVTGRFRVRGERDRYTFRGRKGEFWDVVAKSSRNSSSVDAVLSVVGPDGKPVAAKEVVGDGEIAHVLFSLAADGDHQVLVSDVSGKEPNADAVYRLVVKRASPGFQLRSVGILNVPIGDKAVMNVAVSRDGGFQGPITLSMRGLPAGLTPPKELVVPANAETFSIAMECAGTASSSASFVDIVGTAEIDGRTVTHQLKGDFRGDLTAKGAAANLIPHVLMVTTIKPPFKTKAAEADGGRRIPRGATHLSEVLIERNEGFKGEIILDMAGNQQRHRQGIRGPALLVSPDKKSVDYPVFAPEWLETTRTSRIGLIAMAQVPDSKGKSRYALAPMQGQITLSIEGALMKLSHSGDEITAIPGVAFDIGMKLNRSTKFQEDVTLEFVVPDRLKGLVWAKPLAWPRDQISHDLRIDSVNDPRLLGIHHFTAKATALRNHHPVVSECDLEIEFVAGAASTASR